ncbi:hypothetical protein EI94DRAFT_1706276 [Lactarius quietus]|nr:hypothetical protein EI94DRAFT_1706276 [Lactarius quietus]
MVVLSSFATGASVIVAQLCSKLSSVCGSKLREREDGRGFNSPTHDPNLHIPSPILTLTSATKYDDMATATLTTLYTLEMGKAEYSGVSAAKGKERRQMASCKRKSWERVIGGRKGKGRVMRQGVGGV